MINKEQAMIELIDYLIEESGIDNCQKCIHKTNKEVCKYVDTPTKCREGMVQYFARQLEEEEKEQ